jgi:hypothetical protein
MESLKLSYSGPLPEGTPPRWMVDTFELCTRDSWTLLHQQLGTTDFKDNIHYVPYKQFKGDGSRVWSNLMSADWVAKQAVECSLHKLITLRYSLLSTMTGSDSC